MYPRGIKSSFNNLVLNHQLTPKIHVIVVDGNVIHIFFCQFSGNSFKSCSNF